MLELKGFAKPATAKRGGFVAEDTLCISNNDRDLIGKVFKALIKYDDTNKEIEMVEVKLESLRIVDRTESTESSVNFLIHTSKSLKGYVNVSVSVFLLEEIPMCKIPKCLLLILGSNSGDKREIDTHRELKARDVRQRLLGSILSTAAGTTVIFTTPTGSKSNLSICKFLLDCDARSHSTLFIIAKETQLVLEARWWGSQEKDVGVKFTLNTGVSREQREYSIPRSLRYQDENSIKSIFGILSPFISSVRTSPSERIGNAPNGTVAVRQCSKRGSKRGTSLLLTGDYGCGKRTLVRQLKALFDLQCVRFDP